MFPTSGVSTSKSLLDPHYVTSKNADLMNVGEEEEVDKLLQLLNSGQIRTALIKKFDLINHYRINIQKKGAYKKLYSKLEDNLHISRTEYNSVVVVVWDEDPVIAANMANEVGVLVDTVFNTMLRERAQRVYRTVKSEYDSLTNYIGKLQDTLNIMGKLGLYDLGGQARELNRAYYSALMKGKTDVANMVKKQLDYVSANGGRFFELEELIQFKHRQQYELTLRLSESKLEATTSIPQKIVLDYASVADSKDSPKRMLIVLVSAVSAFFVALFCFIITENIKKLM
jgi:hypothetical protein